MWFPFHAKHFNSEGYFRYIHVAIIAFTLLISILPVGVVFGTGGYVITIKFSTITLDLLCKEYNCNYLWISTSILHHLSNWKYIEHSYHFQDSEHEETPFQTGTNMHVGIIFCCDSCWKREKYYMLLKSSCEFTSTYTLQISEYEFPSRIKVTCIFCLLRSCHWCRPYHHNDRNSKRSAAASRPQHLLWLWSCWHWSRQLVL